MPYEVAIPSIEAAIKALLVADTTLTGLLANKPTARGGGPAIYADGDVPTGATFPYLTIGAWTQVGEHSLSPSGSPGASGYGWNCTGQLKVVGQRNETQLMNVMSAIYSVLPDGRALTVAGYGSACVAETTLQPSLKTTLAGLVTIEVPAIVRIYVFDA